MAAISSLLLATAVAGTAVSSFSAYKEYEGRKDVTAASKRAERLREQQMRLEEQRRQRELIRQTQNARALSLARHTAQGINLGSSSVGGAFGQIGGAYGRASLAGFQNAEIGAGIFAANRDIADAQGQVSTFQGLGSFGNQLTQNSYQIAQIGSQLWTPQGRPQGQ